MCVESELSIENIQNYETDLATQNPTLTSSRIEASNGPMYYLFLLKISLNYNSLHISFYIMIT